MLGISLVKFIRKPRFSYADLYNCMWYLIKLIKKNKITISFGKNGYYYSYKEYKPKLENIKIVGSMLDCILFSNYLKRTVFI